MTQRLQNPDAYIGFGCRNYYSVVFESESFCYICKHEMKDKARRAIAGLAKLQFAKKENAPVIKKDSFIDEDNSKSVHCQMSKKNRAIANVLKQVFEGSREEEAKSTRPMRRQQR
jgi:hypothetical protein